MSKWKCVAAEFGEGENKGLVAYWVEMEKPSLCQKEADLITAAPDMYQALKVLAEKFPMLLRAVGNPPETVEANIYVKNALAALAKADGQ